MSEAISTIGKITAPWRKIYILLFIDLIISATLYLISPTAAMIAAFAIICMTFIMINPCGLVYFLLLTAPLITLITSYSVELKWIRILITSILIVYFMARLWLSGEKIEFLPSRLMNPVLILILYVILTMFFAKSIFKVSIEIIHLFYYLAISISVFNLIKTRQNIRTVQWIVMLMTITLSIASIMVYRLGASRVGLLDINPNSFSMLLLSGFGFGMYYHLTMKGVFKRLPSLITMIFSTLAIITTGSRGGLLALLVFFLSFLWFSGKRKTVFTLIVAGIGSGFLMLAHDSVLLQIAQKARFFSGLTGRPELWKGGLGVISDNFIFGTGMGCVGEVLRFYMNMANPLIPLFTHIPVLSGKLHNGYLQMMAEVGIFGISIILWANYRFITYLLGNIRKAKIPEAKIAGSFAMALMITYICRAFFESTFPLGIVMDNILVLVTYAIVVRVIETKKAEADSSGSQ